jgi:hypothetical protein
MMRSMGESMLTALMSELRELESRLHDPEATARHTMAVGRSLLAFAEREHDLFSALLPLLDPAVQASLAADHRAIEEDLELLRSLLETVPGSPDIAVLSASLARRMREHIDRDRRLLARAATLQS